MAQVADLIFKASFGDLLQAKGVVGELKDKMKETQEQAEKMGHEMSNASKIGAGLGAALGVGIGVVTEMIHKSLENADALSKLSQQTMVSTKTLSEWQYGAKLADVNTEELSGSLVKLNKVMDAAFSGDVKANQVFDRMGVSAVDSSGKLKSTETVMYELADSFKGMEDNASKAALASELFGKAAGPKMLPFLNEGSEGIKKLNAEALKFGLVITEETGKKAEEFNDNLTRMGQVAGGMGTQITASLLPTLSHLGEMFTKVGNDGQMMDSIAQGIAVTLKSLVSVGVVLAGVFRVAGTAIGATAAALVMAATGDFKGAWETIKAGVSDVGDKISSTAGTVVEVWDDAASKVEAKSEENGKKLAAPAEKAAKKTKDAQIAIRKTLAEYVMSLQEEAEKYGKADDALKQYDFDKKASLVTDQKIVDNAQAMFDIWSKELKIKQDLELQAKEAADFRDQQSKDQAEWDKGQIDNEEKMKDAAQKTREEYEKIAYPLKQYGDALDKLDEAYTAGTISEELYHQAQGKIIESATTAAKSLKDKADEQKGLMKDLISAAEGYGKKMGDAFVDWMVGAKTDFKSMVASMMTEMAKMLAYQALFKPLTQAIGGFFGMSFNNGAVFSGGAPSAFANGLISSPTTFGMAGGGTGMAGESGTEAIMPLRRDANGRLGVSGGGGGGNLNNTININISNVKASDSDAVSKAAQDGVDRAMRGLVVSELHNQLRIGNSLNPLALSGFGQ